MAKLVVLYKKPSDTAKFDAHYAKTHIPLAKKIPGVRRYEVSRGPVNTPAGPSPYHLVAVLEFDSADAIARGLGTPEGQAAAGDLSNFAMAGVDLLVFDSQDA
jgi:uncharacterized protein (TIGR02118 family)